MPCLREKSAYIIVLVLVIVIDFLTKTQRYKDAKKRRGTAVAHRMWVILGRIRIEAPG